MTRDNLPPNANEEYDLAPLENFLRRDCENPIEGIGGFLHPCPMCDLGASAAFKEAAELYLRLFPEGESEARTEQVKS